MPGLVTTPEPKARKALGRRWHVWRSAPISSPRHIFNDTSRHREVADLRVSGRSLGSAQNSGSLRVSLSVHGSSEDRIQNDRVQRHATAA